MGYISFRHFGDLFLALEKIDRVLAEEAHAKPCGHCQGQLDVANYYRKARGIGHGEAVIKFALCCRKTGCRKRVQVESMRFLGGFIYGSFFVLLTSVLRNGDRRRFKNLLRRFDISPRTLKRWEHFWDNIFPLTSFWKERKARVPDFLRQRRFYRGYF